MEHLFSMFTMMTLNIQIPITIIPFALYYALFTIHILDCGPGQQKKQEQRGTECNKKRNVRYR